MTARWKPFFNMLLLNSDHGKTPRWSFNPIPAGMAEKW